MADKSALGGKGTTQPAATSAEADRELVPDATLSASL